LEVGVGPVMNQAVGRWTKQALVEEREKQRSLHALVVKAVGALPFFALAATQAGAMQQASHPKDPIALTIVVQSLATEIQHLG
jgi:hypothetical protein